MIIGIGHDIVDVRRIEKLIQRFGKRFLERCFTKSEIQYAQSKQSGGLYTLTLAKRFAAKEACAKALGTGIAKGITFQNFEVTRNENGKPYITLTGRALDIANTLLSDQTQTHIHLSLSDEPPYASAYVVIETI